MKDLIKKILKENDFEWAEALFKENPVPYLKIKQATTNPKNVIKLITHFMCGDGDSYSRKEMFFMLDMSKVKKYRTYSMDEFKFVRDFMEKRHRAYPRLVNLDEYDEEGYDSLWGLGLRHSDEGGYDCGMDNYELFFYDDKGVEYEADFDFM